MRTTQTNTDEGKDIGGSGSEDPYRVPVKGTVVTLLYGKRFIAEDVLGDNKHPLVTFRVGTVSVGGRTEETVATGRGREWVRG